MYTYIYIYICMYVCVYVSTYMYTLVCVHICIHIYIYIYGIVIMVLGRCSKFRYLDPWGCHWMQILLAVGLLNGLVLVPI